MDPVTTVCSGECTVTHVVTLELAPFTLTLADAGLITLAIAGVWLVGFTFRVLIQMVKDSDQPSQASSD